MISKAFNKLPPFLHGVLAIACEGLGFLLGGLLFFVVIVVAINVLKLNTGLGAALGSWSIPFVILALIAMVGLPVGGGYLFMRLVGKWKIPCPKCGAKAHIFGVGSKSAAALGFRCSGCEHVEWPFNFSDVDWEKNLVNRFVRATSILWRLPFIGICLLLVLIMFGVAGPLVFGMFALTTFLITLLRLIPPRNTQWGEFFLTSFGGLFLVASVIAVFRGLPTLPIAFGMELTGERDISWPIPGIDTAIGHAECATACSVS